MLVIHQPATLRLPAVPPLYKMCHFIVLIPLISPGTPDMISHNIKWLGSKGIVVRGLGTVAAVESGANLA